MNDEPIWLIWARQIQALAQTGLAYTEDVFDQERYAELRKISAEIITAHSATPHAVLSDSFEKELGYATPKFSVRAAIFQGDKVLLVRERTDNLWSLPGGWADVNASPTECVIKEVLEESGFAVKATKLVGLYDKRKHDLRHQLTHIYIAYYLCEIIGGHAQAGVETCDVAFCAMDRLPELSMLRTSPILLQRCYDHYLQPDLPTEFD